MFVCRYYSPGYSDTCVPVFVCRYYSPGYSDIVNWHSCVCLQILFPWLLRYCKLALLCLSADTTPLATQMPCWREWSSMHPKSEPETLLWCCSPPDTMRCSPLHHCLQWLYNVIVPHLSECTAFSPSFLNTSSNDAFLTIVKSRPLFFSIRCVGAMKH